MRRLSPTGNPNLLVGTLTGDDAAVWRVDEDRALVFTADFITPVVDDPHIWGRVAASNAVSDVYAMGGRPLLGLNLVCWNTEELSTELLGEVLQGGLDIANECGFVVAGGHTVDDPEPKYGMAVVGEVHPDRMLTNAGLVVGQSLILTKPLGSGIITTGIKRGSSPPDVAAAAINSMMATNASAAKIAITSGATGATDVTGFGLLVHASRMCEESGISLRLDISKIPMLDGAVELAKAGVVPGGTTRNLAFVEQRLKIGSGVTELDLTIVADPQTSGGLLFGLDAEQASFAIAELTKAGLTASIIGEVVTGDGDIHLYRT